MDTPCQQASPLMRGLSQALHIALVGLALSILICGVNPAQAQEPETTPEPDAHIPQPHVYNPTETIIVDFPSAQIGQTYRLFISLPRSYETLNRAYPVLYVLDGNGLFTSVRDITEILQIPNHVPEMIIVGIGYPEATYMDTLGLRGRDLTFHELSSGEITASGYPFEETGGGFQFLDFLQEELIPFIEKTYRAKEGDRGLVGWSLAGSAGLYSMFHQPGLFRRIISISPSFDLSGAGIPPLEETYSDQNTSLEVELFVASEEPTQPLLDFVGTLESRDYTGFELTTVYYEGESHFSVVPRAITDGLRALY